MAGTDKSRRLAGAGPGPRPPGSSKPSISRRQAMGPVPEDEGPFRSQGGGGSGALAVIIGVAVVVIVIVVAMAAFGRGGKSRKTGSAEKPAAVKVKNGTKELGEDDLKAIFFAAAANEKKAEESANAKHPQSADGEGALGREARKARHSFMESKKEALNENLLRKYGITAQKLEQILADGAIKGWDR